MNNEQWNGYLEGLQMQMDNLQQTLLPYLDLEMELPLIDQMQLQGYMSDTGLVRMQVIVASIKGLVALAANMEQSIKEHFADEEHKSN